MRAAAARIEGATFESILTCVVFKSPLVLGVDVVAQVVRHLTTAHRPVPRNDLPLETFVPAVSTEYSVTGTCQETVAPCTALPLCHAGGGC